MKKTIALFYVLLLLFSLTSVTAAAADEEETVELARLVGTWAGEGTSKTGDVPITLTVRIAPDGTGVYEFVMESMGKPYHESYPFLLSREDSRFSLDTPAEYPGKIEGTWELKDNVLLLDIVSTFAGGGESAWVAECRKTAVTEGIPAEYEWLSYTLFADSAELVPGTEVDRSPLSKIKDKTFFRIRLLDKDGEIALKDIEEEANIRLFTLTDADGEPLPLYSISYWNVGFDDEKGFYTNETQEGFFLYYLAEGELSLEDLVFAVSKA
ncbi:MAG: hypothetical protein IKD63_00335 [Oscillospiraceae bacterium]|nr:hypothetical protein [Oscillospiraceae bacterium]